MSDYRLNLLVPEYSYLFGFLQADGHLYQNTRNRGKLTVELNSQDIWLLEQFAQMVPFYSSVRIRTRRTNFSASHTSVTWSVHSREFREALTSLKFPTGKKSDAIEVPQGNFVPVDYFRGIIDADGSLGITASGLPFVSLITASDNLAQGYTAFVADLIGYHKRIHRNTRDNVFNTAIFREDAQAVSSILYYENCLALPRKLAKLPNVMHWQRPDSMKKIRRRLWCEEQDTFILTHSVEESTSHLKRTPQSVKMRLWRLLSEK